MNEDMSYTTTFAGDTEFVRFMLWKTAFEYILNIAECYISAELLDKNNVLWVVAGFAIFLFGYFYLHNQVSCFSGSWVW